MERMMSMSTYDDDDDNAGWTSLCCLNISTLLILFFAQCSRACCMSIEHAACCMHDPDTILTNWKSRTQREKLSKTKYTSLRSQSHNFFSHYYGMSEIHHRIDRRNVAWDHEIYE